MVRKAEHMTQRDLSGIDRRSLSATAVSPSRGDVGRREDTKNRQTGVRASIVAWKSGNADGAKGRRKMDVR